MPIEKINQDVIDISLKDLNDTFPADYTNHAGDILQITQEEDGITFIPPTFLMLEDTPATFTGGAGLFLRINQDADEVIFASADLTDITGFPSSYPESSAGYFVRVKTEEDGVEFVAPEVPVVTFLGLTDTPSAYTTAGQIVKIADNGISLDFGPAPITDAFPQVFLLMGV